MQLLKPPEGKSLRDVENAREELRAQQLDKVIKDKRREINDLEVLTVQTLSIQGKHNYEEELAWKARITALTTEVVELEARRQRALRPLIEKEEELRTKECALIEQERELLLKEAALQQSNQTLTQRFVDVEKREKWASAKKNELDKRTVEVSDLELESSRHLAALEAACNSASDKEMVTRETIAALGEELDTLREERKVLLTPLRQREDAFNSRVLVFEAREGEFNRRTALFERQEKELVNRIAAIERDEDAIKEQKTLLETENDRLGARKAAIDNMAIEKAGEAEKAILEVVKKEDGVQKRAENLAQKMMEYEEIRKTVIVPLVNREQVLQNNERALLKREEHIAIRETENDSERQLLEDRFDDISEREQATKDYSATLEQRARNIALQEGEFQKHQDSLVVLLREFSNDKKKAEDDISTQRALLKGRETILLEREKICAKQEAGFANREKSILAKYRQLQKAITATNLKNNGHN